MDGERTFLSESTLRRPAARLDVKVRLADSQEWWIPRPIVSFRLRFGDDGRPAFSQRVGSADAYWELFQRFNESGGIDELNAMAEMVVSLLRENYDLTDADLVALLPYDPSDPASAEMWGSLSAIALGRTSPKGEDLDDI